MPRHARVVLAAGVAVIAACGGDDDSTPMDAPLDEAPAVRCDPTKPFGAPAFITELATDKAEIGARLYDGEKLVVFARRGASNLFDLWTSTRASTTEPWGAPTPLASVNSVANEAWPSQTPDGLTLVFEGDRTAVAGSYRPWISRRTATSDPWGPPALVPELNVGDHRPYLANESALYFVSTTRGGPGGGDMYRADVGAGGALSAPVLLAGNVNSATTEEAPTLTADERTLFFRRETITPDPDPMVPPSTEYDIWAATRGSAGEDFGPPALVENLSAPGVVETPSWISADGCVLYGTIDGPDDMGGGDLFVASRPL